MKEIAVNNFNGVLMIKNSKDNSYVLYEDGSYQLFKIPALKLINLISLYNGSSLYGSLDSFKYITNAIQKPSIYINNDLFLIPTMSMKNIDCQFINYEKIVKIKSVLDKTLIIFVGGYKLEINCSYRTMKTQINRCKIFIDSIRKGIIIYEDI